ncbi:exodeoxyribonuclease V subunit alpha [Acinetobacter sp.]|uniref:exodeoxyribonuclease V subunit alpha n=1 Tax=Acinetobacter sp. TaxID=472 RepID=UPI0035B04C44
MINQKLTSTQNDSETPTWATLWSGYLSQINTQNHHLNKENQSLVKNYLLALSEALERGDSCIALTEKPQNINDFLLDVSEYQAQELFTIKQLKPMFWGHGRLYLQRYWAYEQTLAQRIASLLSEQVEQVDLNDYRSLFEDPYQQQALAQGVNSAFSLITGGPGTGKTFVLTHIVAVLKKIYPDMRIAMVAPTGKAAQRMQEALQKAFQNPKLLDAGLYHPDFAHQKTQTIHRLLGIGERGVSRFDASRPLGFDVIVVDEASMLDLHLAKLLFDAIQAPTRVIILGDANQLTSVDVGYVLADFQQVPALQQCHVQLKHSRRFVDDAKIGQFAKLIYATDRPSYADFLEKAQPQMLKIGNEIPKLEQVNVDWLGFYLLEQSENTPLSTSTLISIYRQLALGYQAYFSILKDYLEGKVNHQHVAQIFDQYRILVAMRHGALGLAQLNLAMTQHLKHALNLVQDSEWFVGRAVMVNSNDYQLGLSNGDIGICLPHPDKREQLEVYFPSLDKWLAVARLPQSIQTAFALTIHKSQGSEFDHVAVVLDQSAQRLMGKELLYTAITRAKKMVSLFSSVTMLEHSLAVRTQRQSGLSAQIIRAIESNGL